MLFTSERPGVLATRDYEPQPVKRTAWMVAEPAPELNPTGYFRLAPGVFIVKRTNAWPVSVLDVAERLPWDYDAEPIKRKFPYTAWHASATCRDAVEADSLFFGTDDEDRPTLPPRYLRRARAMCIRCPVKRECLTQALGAPEIFGVWAGTTERQRRPLRARIKAGENVQSVVDECLTT